jgi:hypothetical protein
VVKHNGRACAFRDTTARGCAARGGGSEVQKHGTIYNTNVRSAVTRRAYRVLGQGRATIGGEICLRNPAVGTRAAIRGEGGQGARGVSRGGAGNPRFRGKGEPTCSPLVTSFASAISYGKFVRGAGWWSGSGRALGGSRGRNVRVKAPDRGRIQIRGCAWWISGGGPATIQQASSRAWRTQRCQLSFQGSKSSTVGQRLRQGLPIRREAGIQRLVGIVLMDTYRLVRCDSPLPAQERE